MTMITKGIIVSVSAIAGAIGLFLNLSFSPAEANPTVSAGRIIGTIVERGTNEPIIAEVGITTLGEASVLLKHSRASQAGEYVIEGLPGGQVHLVTKAEGFAVEHRDVYLNEGEIFRADFQLEKVKQVKGVIRNPEGLPVSNANVRVIYPAVAVPRGSVATTYQWEAGDIKTGPEGRFAIDVHPEKQFIVEASHPDFIAAVSSPTRVEPTQNEASVNLSLVRGTTLVGTLRDGSDNIVVGAQVRLIESGNTNNPSGFISPELLRQRTRYTRSAPDGTFRFDSVNRSEKMLVINHPNYHTFREVVDLTSGPVASKSVQLQRK